MKRKITLLLLLFAGYTSMYAVTARPGIVIVKQSDGYKLSTLLFGDENFHYRTTIDGYVLLTDQKGNYVYAQPLASNELVPSSTVAHDLRDRSVDENKFLATIKPHLPFGEKMITHAKMRKLKQQNLTQKIHSSAKIKTGQAARYLVILVNFSDLSFSTPNPQDRYDRQINSANYTDDGATGSVAKYFSDNSLQAFTPVFDVYGPVTLSRPYAYYGQNDQDGNDENPSEMVTEACSLLDSSVDFSVYDADSDGYIDNIYVIYAGKGEASGGDLSTIWPHAGSTFPSVSLDNVQTGSYSCSNELKLDGTIDGIGTMCHEFSHVIGLPDFYDTDYATNGEAYGLGGWDLMSNGNYNNDSKTPPYYTSVERRMMGWGNPGSLTIDKNYSIPPISQNEFYRLYSPVTNEYFMLENRQNVGWDTYIPGHGLMIYHIDKTSAYIGRWNDDNNINAFADHPCDLIVSASGSLMHGKETSFPFPGSNNVTEIKNTTTPNLLTWDGTPSDKILRNITETAEGVITFDLISSANIPAITTLSATDVGSTSFTGNWNASANCTTLLLDVYQKSTVQTKIQSFPSGAPELPWDYSSSVSFPSYDSQYYALFQNKDSYVLSEPYSDAISSIDLHVECYTNSLNVLVSTDNSTWDVLRTIPQNTILDSYTISVDPNKNYRYVKFVCNDDLSFIFITNISVTYGGTKTYVAHNLNVLGQSTYPISALEPGGTYYYKLTASNDYDTTVSNETMVQLLVFTADKQVQWNNCKVYTQNHSIGIISPDSKVVAIVNAFGQVIYKGVLHPGLNNITVPSGMYILRADSSTTKVIVR